MKLHTQAVLCRAAPRPTLRQMRIGIIGAGSLGSALGERLGRAGHEIMVGGGDRAREVASRMAAGVGSNSDAAAFGDVVVLAVPFAAIEAALDGAATEGRVLWSCGNALRHDLSGLAVGSDSSAAEQVARQARGARVVAAIPPFAHAIAAGTLAYDRGTRAVGVPVQRRSGREKGRRPTCTRSRRPSP
jgi:8-hydroxy-5-deazaflavin:NADPH oxidoreductase